MGNWIEAGRPALRFAPKRGWINDPNGLIFYRGEYHLFAQHNPDATIPGPMHWLHAVSGDMIHWEERGIALYPNALGTMFSGSAVCDDQNTAGFGAGAMVLVFTQHGATQTQGIAYSTDGQNFTVYDGNPVIDNPGIRDFRDPKVFWDAPRNRWAMALSAFDRVAFYASADLKKWTKTGEFGKAENRLGGVFECPDLFALQAPDGREIWALLLSMGASPAEGGCRIQYFLGDFDGETFTQTEAIGETLMLDKGFDDYAGVTFSGTDERVFFGWAANACYAGDVPAGPFRGSFTLPRRLFLMDTNQGVRVAALPILPEAAYDPIADGGELPDGAYELRLAADDAFELSLESPAGEVLRMGLDDGGMIYIDRSAAGQTDFHEWFGKPLHSIRRTPRMLSGGFEMRVIVDYTGIEIYAEGGAFAASLLAFPAQPYHRVNIQNARAQLVRRTVDIGGLERA